MEFGKRWNRNWKEWKDLNAKMRKDKSNWSLILRDQKRKEERRRGEEEEEEEIKKRREGERKSKRYGTLYSFVWIHVYGLWIVRNLMSRPESRPDPIGRSEPVSGTRDHILGLFT